VLQQVPVFRELAEDAANHHERIDGQGYFRGLTGDQLSPTARVLCVADVADALMSERPYRAALPVDEVIALLTKGRGTQFWPEVVDALAVSLAATPAA
jgi:HD-GYP domain-containing protein (c-di-GMP phosphodiesterase class II)